MITNTYTHWFKMCIDLYVRDAMIPGGGKIAFD